MTCLSVRGGHFDSVSMGRTTFRAVEFTLIKDSAWSSADELISTLTTLPRAVQLIVAEAAN